jgi:dipeptidyl aminopeptidase/acylaminoacyl peptidase
LSFVSYPALFRSGLVPYWSVDAKTGGTSELMRPLGNTNHDEVQLSAFDPAKGHASLLTRTGTQYVLSMTTTGNRPAWSVAAHVQLIDQQKGPAPLNDQGRNELISAGPTRIAFLEQSLTAQPQLYSKVIATGQLTALTNINPYISQRRLGNIQRLDWTKKELRYSGFIVFPSNYKAGVKYPCVIMAKSWDDHSFVLEDQDGYRAGNFPIQLMAAQGILVFMAREPEAAPDTRYSHDVGTEQFFGPRRELVARGLVDGQRCAAMGFSSTAFELQFALTHSKGENPFAAAVIVDGYSIDYGFNALLSAHSLQQLLGSSSTGSQTKSIEHVQAEMMKASPAWNASEVRTPALIIYHGTSPMDGAELYSALWASGKPVDFNWYPDEEHTLQAPLARLSNAMLELDWFRFWLLGIVPPKSEWDPERPVRWEKLRQQQTQNEMWLASGKNPTDEFLKSP